MTMLRRLSRTFSRKWTLRRDPVAARWEAFRVNTAIVPEAMTLVQSVPDSRLRDVTYLEQELIPALGLNDENLQEQPEELSQFFGRGLHIFQYPNQLARYMVWLAEQASDTRTYVEIGSRWGGTFILVCEWLRRIGAPLDGAIAIDPIGETPMLQMYGECLSREGIGFRFIKDSSTSPSVQTLFRETQPDFVFIDGDHSMKGALADHILARKSATIIVHHDIASDACPETTALWNALRELENGSFVPMEFIDQYPSVQGSYLGIGALKRRVE